MTLRSLFLILIITILPALPLSAGEQDPPGFQFLPSGRLVSPLRASATEPRIGVFKYLDVSDMKVDIGNGIDLFGWQAGTLTVRAGIDFFAYARTTGHDGLRLQIDAIDGFFGGDLSARLPVGETQFLEARFRALHHSAHLADGHYSVASHAWLGNQEPIPFTRDFGELTILCLFQDEHAVVRPYAGFGYATLVRPVLFRRSFYHTGIEWYNRTLSGALFGQPVLPFIAYNCAVAGTPVYRASHQIQVGMKFGEWNGKGPSFFAAYYDGMEFFGEYFTNRVATIGVGFTVDF